MERASKHRYLQVQVLNGFCFMISRELIEVIGYLDEETFPRGYGEEVYLSLDIQMKACTDLSVIREEIKQYYSEITGLFILEKKIAFMLTARGGSSGANSVCQEAMGMHELGVQASVSELLVLNEGGLVMNSLRKKRNGLMT